jgi:galactokinase
VLTDPQRPPFFNPYLQALDSLNDRHPALSASAIKERVGELSGPDSAIGFAFAPTGILGEHTHYFDGFALLMPLPLGIAVGASPSNDVTTVYFDGDERTWSSAEEGVGAPAWVRLVFDLTARLAPDRHFNLKVVSTAFPECFDAYVAAISVAAARAVLKLSEDAAPERSLVRELKSIVEASTGIPFSPAYIIGAFHGRPSTILLVDAATFEHLPVLTAEDDEPAWALVQAGGGLAADFELYRSRKLAAERAVADLQAAAFPGLSSFRELAHRHLERALEEVADERRGILRHLVTENRRVQKAVTALRKGDWQFLGALLLMSHASAANDWGGTSADADHAIRIAESLSIDGIHGGCMTSRGGAVLVCGRRFVMPLYLEKVAADFRSEFGYEPRTIILPSSQNDQA